MRRLFTEHEIRNTMELEGFWNFTCKDSKKMYSLPVPGCWEQHPELENYRGTGIYTKDIDLKQDCNIRLLFEGVSHSAEVYLDEQLIASHYNAFTGFDAVAKHVKAGSHQIRVVADNSFSERSALHMPNDYYTYGGLIRPVILEKLQDVYIERVRFTSAKKDKVWQGEFLVQVKNLSENAKYIVLEAGLLSMKYKSDVTRLEPGQTGNILFYETFESVSEWCPKSPNLHYLHTIVSTVDELGSNKNVVDDLIERIGFREVSLIGQKLCINQKFYFLKGFNRHEDQAVTGAAQSLQQMARDVEILLDLGANAVRGSHYPNDQRFLDLCDERGILFWEENHARGLVLDKMLNPNFELQCHDCIEEMILQHHNHPSIIIWGILNECASETEEGRRMYQSQYEQIRSMDMSRPLTSATCRHFTDICLDLPDIVSFNIYTKWYEDAPVAERHNQEMDWIAAAGGAGKPVIVSEFGAGAVYGFRDTAHSKWSEERQKDILEEHLKLYMEDERLTGIFIWQFADCRVTEEGWFAVRPRSHNNKGIVDEYRRHKLAYEMVKDIFRNWNNQ